MLSFARGSHAGSERVDLRGLMEGLATLLRGSIPSNVRLELAPADAAIELEGNHTELQQVLLNLCLNALQAMPDGGDLRISTTSVDLDGGFFESIEECGAGRYLAIAVTDTGVGMSGQVRARLFEPFFTTKASGTGLGLLSCRRIIGNHGGCLRVASTPGNGTTFTVYLPLAAHAGAERGVDEIPRGRGERVLVVIERAGKLSLLGSIIGDHGYSATLAQDGALALQALEREGMPDAVLMEAQMSLMTGVRTCAALLERGYDGPVLLIAPRGGTAGDDEMPPLPRVRRIDKPVVPAQLLAVLDEELHDAADERSP
jgi:CheY-like chemotaxis protein